MVKPFLSIIFDADDQAVYEARGYPITLSVQCRVTVIIHEVNDGVEYTLHIATSNTDFNTVKI